MHHSELTDPQLARLGEVVANLGRGRSFSATEALTAALQAGIQNPLADIDSSLSDLEDAGVIREVQKNPPRWQAVTNNTSPPQTGIFRSMASRFGSRSSRRKVQ